MIPVRAVQERNTNTVTANLFKSRKQTQINTDELKERKTRIKTSAFIYLNLLVFIRVKKC